MAQDGFPLGDRAGLVADLHLRTVSTMDKLRETLRDEHSCLMQVGRATTSVQLSSSHRISATCIDLSCHTPGSEHASFDDVYAMSANCPYDSIPRLRADYILCPSQFMLTVWRRVFTPFQVAQLAVQTYPHSADILAMIKCVVFDIRICRPQFPKAFVNSCELHPASRLGLAVATWLSIRCRPPDHTTRTLTLSR